MKRVLVTGTGFVGARILQQLAGRLELTAFPRGVLAKASREEIAEAVRRARPDCILHTAALSDTGYCQAHPEESYRANVLVPLWIAEAAKEAGAGLVAFSSDQVYAGLEGSAAFAESLPLSPANIYGQHKYEAEQRVLDVLPGAVLLRATWLYDLPGYALPIRGNLPLNLWLSALTGQPLRFSCRDFRGVTYVRQAVENLIPAMDLSGGVYNYGSENDTHMYETARRFCAAMGIDPPLEKGDWSRSLLMDTRKAQAGGVFFDSTCDGICRCLRDYGLAP